ncbi:MAG: hypothetical protein IJS33_00355 [Firmicutes bacterium]|nr:hypothetical protein [Bacillota bacterium]
MQKKNVYRVFTTLSIIMLCVLLAACGAQGENAEQEGGAQDPASKINVALEGFETPDMSGYTGLEGYQGDIPFVEVTVMDIHRLKEEKASFALFTSYKDCPWCNAAISYFCDTANEAGVKVAYINTRKNPEWVSNIDIDDYDIFVEDFGDALELDANGIKHLYVPHVFFVKEGELVYDYQGAYPDMGGDPHMELSDVQKEELRDIFREGFDSILK